MRTDESQAIDDYIRSNYLNVKDEVIGMAIGLTSAGVNSRRRRMGLSKPQPLADKSRIAVSLEMFCNGATVVSIARRFNTSHRAISLILNKNFFYKQRSYNTITLVMDSKINYDAEYEK